jgi:hypothetical protein
MNFYPGVKPKAAFRLPILRDRRRPRRNLERPPSNRPNFLLRKTSAKSHVKPSAGRRKPLTVPYQQLSHKK